MLAKADADAFRLALRSEAGLADNLANGSIDIQKFNRFLDEVLFAVLDGYEASAPLVQEG